MGHNHQVLLELDAGELDDEPEELWAMFDALNIACGGHAGDPVSMTRAIGFCARTGLRAGAHPSYPDRLGFGRRSLEMAQGDLVTTIAAQCGALAAIARVVRIEVHHVKPHGALYHDAATRRELADAVVEGAIRALGTAIAVIGPPRGALLEAARARDLAYLREGFADRRTRRDGTLVPRGELGAIVEDPRDAVVRARALAGEVDALCLHADTPGALHIARAVREVLDG